MRLAFVFRQDVKKFLAVTGISLAFIVAQAAPAIALSSDPDGDGLRSGIERNVTETSPRDADSDDDRIKDGQVDEDLDGVDNLDEDDFATGIDDDTDNDGVEDGIEDEDADNEQDGDEDDADEDDDCDDVEDEDDDDDDGDGVSDDVDHDDEDEDEEEGEEDDD